jgi:hypothetical protein
MPMRSKGRIGVPLGATIISLGMALPGTTRGEGRCVSAAASAALVSRTDRANRRALQRALVRRKLERTSLEPVRTRFGSHAALASWLERLEGVKGKHPRRSRFRRDQLLETRRGRLVVMGQTTVACGGKQMEHTFVRDRRGVIYRLEAQPRWRTRRVRVCGCPPPRAPGCPLGPATVIPVYVLPADAKYGGRIAVPYRATTVELRHRQEGCHSLPRQQAVP